MRTGKIFIGIVIGMMVLSGPVEGAWTIGDLEAASGLDFNGDMRQFASGAAAYELIDGNKVYKRVWISPDGQYRETWKAIDLSKDESHIWVPFSHYISDVEVSTFVYYQGAPDYTPVSPFDAAVEISFDFPLWNGEGDDVALFFVSPTILQAPVEIGVQMGGGYQATLTPVLSGDLKDDYKWEGFCTGIYRDPGFFRYGFLWGDQYADN
ncbi:MAG: hypothetical protein GY869_09280 [Planctomycetes bacterium]|nr:hypothetical protein [Planctomycetota bacterium]